jgi:GntR family transcriptional repressor for pyruvate dehydrogenase complex
MPGRREKQYQEHQAILQAIKGHDTKKAGEAMLKHLRNVREVLVKI